MTSDTHSRSDRRSRIVEVAAQLLQEQGPSAVTTRGVAEAAGVQAPTIYRLFGDKDGLLDSVAEHVMATYVLAKAAVVQAAQEQDVDPLEDLRSGWNAQVDFGLVNPALFRLLSDPQRIAPSPAARAGRQVLESRVRRLAATGRLRVSERRAVDLIQAAGLGTIQLLLSTAAEDRDPDLADGMWNAVAHQILVDAPAPPADGTKAAAVTLRAVSPELTVLTGAERRLLSEWLERVVATGQPSVTSSTVA